MGERLDHRSIWSATKAAYSALIAKSDRWEIAESFFNSLTRRVFATEGVDQTIEFVDTDFDAAARPKVNVRQSYHGRSLTQLLIDGLTNVESDGFAANCWDDLGADAAAAAAR